VPGETVADPSTVLAHFVLCWSQKFALVYYLEHPCNVYIILILSLCCPSTFSRF
jgi:hypothetical protein